MSSEQAHPYFCLDCLPESDFFGRNFQPFLHFLKHGTQSAYPTMGPQAADHWYRLSQIAMDTLDETHLFFRLDDGGGFVETSEEAARASIGNTETQCVMTAQNARCKQHGCFWYVLTKTSKI